jgi:hypothetical protein
MKTRIRLQDYNVQTGEVITNKGIFTNNQWEALLNKIKHLHIFYDYREIKCGWIFYDFDPISFMKIF